MLQPGISSRVLFDLNVGEFLGIEPSCESNELANGRKVERARIASILFLGEKRGLALGGPGDGVPPRLVSEDEALLCVVIFEWFVLLHEMFIVCGGKRAPFSRRHRFFFRIPRSYEIASISPGRSTVVDRARGSPDNLEEERRAG